MTSNEFARCPACGSDNIGIVSEESDYHYVVCGDSDCALWGTLGKTLDEAIAKWNQMPREPVWSKELPADAGYYWKRPCDHLEKTVIRVYRQGHGSKRLLYIQVGEAREDVLSGLIHGRYEFAGPIPEPRSNDDRG